MRTRILSSQNIDGRGVVNKDGNSIGHIHGLIVDLQSEQILFAVLYFVGLWWKTNDTYFAVPLNALRFDDNGDSRIMLDMDKKELKDAPKWTKKDVPSTATNELIHSVFDYYGYNPHPSAIYEY